MQQLLGEYFDNSQVSLISSVIDVSKLQTFDGYDKIIDGLVSANS